MNLPYQYGSKKIHCLHVDSKTHEQCNAVRSIIDPCPVCGQLPTQKHCDLLNLATDIDHLQATKNNGRGINCARSIVTYLRRGDESLAKMVYNTDGDKICEVHQDLDELICKGLNIQPRYSNASWTVTKRKSCQSKKQ